MKITHVVFIGVVMAISETKYLARDDHGSTEAEDDMSGNYFGESAYDEGDKEKLEETVTEALKNLTRCVGDDATDAAECFTAFGESLPAHLLHCEPGFKRCLLSPIMDVEHVQRCVKKFKQCWGI